MKAKDIMVSDVPTISKRASLKEAIQLLKKNYGDKSFLNAAPGLIVVNDSGELTGVLMPITILQTMVDDKTADCAETRANGSYGVLCEKLKDKTVEDIMEREPISVTEDAQLLDLAALFVKHRFQRIPVVRDNKVVGIVYRTPLLLAMTSSFC
jgi:CBS domain-containing protein